MAVEDWWPRLAAATQAWLIDNNGDSVPVAVAHEIELAGGGADLVVEHDDSHGVALPDEVVDWIEAVANGEQQ